MYTVPTPVTPIVPAALMALDAFGAINAEQAAVLLGSWSRRAELSDADVADIIGHYRQRTPAELAALKAWCADVATWPLERVAATWHVDLRTAAELRDVIAGGA